MGSCLTADARAPSVLRDREQRETEEREEDRNLPLAVAHQAAAKEMDGCESKEGQLGNSASDD